MLACARAWYTRTRLHATYRQNGCKVKFSLCKSLSQFWSNECLHKRTTPAGEVAPPSTPVPHIPIHPGVHSVCIRLLLPSFMQNFRNSRMFPRENGFCNFLHRTRNLQETLKFGTHGCYRTNGESTEISANTLA